MIGRLWRASNAIARALLTTIPPTHAQRVAIQNLRTGIEGLPGHESPQAASFWAARPAQLKQLVSSKDPRAFLTWNTITETMFPAPYARFAGVELAALRTSGEWSRWKRAIREQMAGLPFPCLFYPLSSSNAIHHGYHLYRFETEARIGIADFHTIFEFGAGYGSLCRIAHRLGFAGKYIIFDFAEMCALQRYYLSSAGISAVTHACDIESLRADLENTRAPRLFVATWSLSEAPLEPRRKIAQLLSGFHAFLIAYQQEFAGINNAAFFREWQSWFPDVTWMVSNIAHTAANTYLFGVRRSAAL